MGTCSNPEAGHPWWLLGRTMCSATPRTKFLRIRQFYGTAADGVDLRVNDFVPAGSTPSV
jgi:hypothetical protein